jgi:hypothetical protein
MESPGILELYCILELFLCFYQNPAPSGVPGSAPNLHFRSMLLFVKQDIYPSFLAIILGKVDLKTLFPSPESDSVSE